MKTFLTIIAIALPLAAQEGFDIKTLDKLGTNAKNKTNLTLEGDVLKLAAGVLSSKSDASAKSLVDSLKGVYIRYFEYDRKGQYNEADLEPLRTFLKNAKWTRVMESREDEESTDIFVLPEAGGKLGGVAIISTEPREVTVVYISGSLRPEDIGKLGGNLGIPDLDSLRDITKGKKEE